jgi:uncharacterized protein (DUF1015 family)
VDKVLDEVAGSRPPDVSVTDDYDVVNQLWCVTDAAKVEQIRGLMADKKLLIADGHHRYETALAFHRENPQLAGADRVMMTFVNMYNPGLRILASHRVLHNLPGFDPAAMLEKLKGAFGVRPMPDLNAIYAAWREPHPNSVRFGVVLEGLNTVYLLDKARDQRLDVQVLHQAILRDALGISDEAVREEKYLHYVRGATAAAEMVSRGEAQAAFLMEPPTVDQVADISFADGVMPQKSTDFYPKMLSGLTIYKL